MFPSEIDEIWLTQEDKEDNSIERDEWLSDPSLRAEERSPSLMGAR